MWKKNTIQKIVEQKAHKNGIRISHICAWGTSKLAYDGSGYALRGTEAGKKSYSICWFPNGKTYNCDLSASYNIGAQVLHPEIQQNQSVKNWSVIIGKSSGMSEENTMHLQYPVKDQCFRPCIVIC